MPRVRLQIAHTSALGDAELAVLRELLDAVFADDMDEHAWDHALGGMHVLVWEGAELAAHGSVIQRRLIHGDRALRAGYVEAVAVEEARRGRGHGAAIMDALGQIITGAYELGALAASEMGARLYRRHGWRPWGGPTWGLTPDGVVRTAEADREVYVLETCVPLDLAGALTCDWRQDNLW